MASSGLIASYGKPVYVRLLPGDGPGQQRLLRLQRRRLLARAELLDERVHRRLAAHRDVLRGGSVAGIDAQLRGARPAAACTASRRARRSRRRRCRSSGRRRSAARPTSRQQPRRLLPGRSLRRLGRHRLLQQFPNFTGLRRFYKRVPAASRSRSASGRSGAATTRRSSSELFKWVDAHHRVCDDALQPGLRRQRPARLGDPASTAAIRSQLGGPRFLGSRRTGAAPDLTPVAPGAARRGRV